MGRNPFSASIMYGEGYDWTPLYSVRSGQMVGALPVGVETRGDSDAPYWPTQICWTYKEVWTQPVGEWIWLMQDISVPALVRGTIDLADREPVEFREQNGGQVITVPLTPFDREFNIHLPQGHYDVRHGLVHSSVTVIPGGRYDLDLRGDHVLDFKVTYQEVRHNEVVVRISGQGGGRHSFVVRSDNLTLREPTKQEMALTPGNTAEVIWHAQVVSSETPWVAVIVPDGDQSERREVTGAGMPHLAR